MSNCVECKKEDAIWIEAPWATHSDGTHPEELICEDCYTKLNHRFNSIRVQGSQYDYSD